MGAHAAQHANLVPSSPGTAGAFLAGMAGTRRRAARRSSNPAPATKSEAPALIRSLKPNPNVTPGRSSSHLRPEPKLFTGKEQLGPYRLCAELASGGMATVYLAEPCVGPRRPLVALKVIHPHLAVDPTFLEMFLDEAVIAAQIRHPNVCRLLDVSSAHHYIAMEYLAGESLAAVWRRLADPSTSRLPGPRLASLVGRILSDACEGLHAAHELVDVFGEPLSVVHRDVSPENVMLTYDGCAKLLDFGVASAARQQHQTRTGILKGKFAYIAPELLLGERADRRADVWGMGATAWELLTGERLFACPGDVETLRAISERRIAPPSEVREDLPRAVDEVVLRALAREPGERYATARELGRALLAASTGEARIASLGDVSDWMRTLFPTGPERSRSLLASASLRPREESPVAPEPPRREPELEFLPSEDLVTVYTTAADAPLTVRALRTGRWGSFGRALRRSALPFVALVIGVGLGQAANLGHPLLEVQRDAAASPGRAVEHLATAPGVPLPLAKPSEPPPPESAIDHRHRESTRYMIDVEQDGGALVLRIEGRPSETLSVSATPEALASPRAEPRRKTAPKERP
jgi:eukaryotic-like serine/threonine-protein kinase